jgi:hypothetical protein
MLAGAALLMLAALVLIGMGPRAVADLAPLKLPVVCALSFLIVEGAVHGGSVLTGFPRLFITWMLGLIIVQSLSLRRDFLHRGALALSLIGFTTVPYLTLGAADQRVSVDAMMSGDFNNSNGLGGWFGFCCLYFTVTGIETKRHEVRVAASLAALACLYIVGLSVSRGALLGTLVGMTIALRRLLRRGFIPVLIALVFSGIVYNLGVFDEIISRYVTRAGEESGRFLVWPVAVERFFSAPLLGVGSADVGSYVPSRDTVITPHNSFIWFALASGVLPLALFVAWWVRAARTALSSGERPVVGPYLLPLLVHTFTMTMVGDLAFMQPWGLITLCVAMAAPTPYARRPAVAQRRGLLPNTPRSARLPGRAPVLGPGVRRLPMVR